MAPLRIGWGEDGRRPDAVLPGSGEGGRKWGECADLAWKKSAPDYVSPFRDGTAQCATQNHVIPAFLEIVFDQPQNGMH